MNTTQHTVLLASSHVIRMEKTNFILHMYYFNIDYMIYHIKILLKKFILTLLKSNKIFVNSKLYCNKNYLE